MYAVEIYAAVRHFVLVDSHSMRDSADEVLITTGSMEALDLIISLFLAPGDAVIAEEATFGVVLARLAGIDVTCRGARQDSHGIDIAHLSQLLAEQKAAGNQAKFIYTIPTLHNPTGTVMPIDRRQQLSALAEQHNCAIIEDDCYAELLWEGERPPAIRSLDATGRVIYCGSFSKSIAPALRVGYLVAN